MTAVMEPEIDWAGVALMEEMCALLHITAPPVRQWVNDYDFDPDAVKDELDKLVTAGRTLSRSGETFDAVRHTEGFWDGDAAAQMCLHVDCQRGVWDHIVDFLLWLSENVVQIIDYVVDVLRIIVAWITFLVTAFSLVAAVVIIIVTAVGGAGVGAVFGALVDSAVLAVAGAIVLIGALVSMLLAGVNWLVEQLQQTIQDARNDICGDGVPVLPDWDPTGFPPAWPV